MAIEHATNGSTPLLESLPTHTPPKAARSAPDTTRRRSLPLPFLPPALWSANTSSASLVQSEEAAHGEHIFDETTVAYRISALRQLNGATRSRHHRYAKSTGARNTTYNQPVIVRTYSGSTRTRSQHRPTTTKKENGQPAVTVSKMGDLKLPPVEAFTFKGIMDEIRHGVTEDLERIAEICARSKYSLSNQYEVHMPPHGRGDQIFQPVTQPLATQGQLGGPTLQAIGSDDEQQRLAVRGPKNARRARSAAYGTLETIMSSSRSSDEDKSAKKPAAVLADEVRGRATARHKLESNTSLVTKDKLKEGPKVQPAPKHIRSRSVTFASIIIDNAQGTRHKPDAPPPSTISLVSEPSRPQTSSAVNLEVVSNIQSLPSISAARPLDVISPASVIRNDSGALTSTIQNEGRPSILNSISSWLPWSRRLEKQPNNTSSKPRRPSYAEGSLREILKSADVDRKGKSADRGG
ncbi:hypothetical protein F5884DRAFT_801075 [Xylogone sp. PMI_703]|nr:hypothetical protein F5884DRAFT_801075 [Xylogone sp. PMI_703]